MKPETTQKIYKWGFFILLFWLIGLWTGEPVPDPQKYVGRAEYDNALSDYVKVSTELVDTLQLFVLERQARNDLMSDYNLVSTELVDTLQLFVLERQARNDLMSDYNLLSKHAGDLVDYAGYCQQRRILDPVKIQHLRQRLEHVEKLKASSYPELVDKENVQELKDEITTAEATLKEYERC